MKLGDVFKVIGYITVVVLTIAIVKYAYQVYISGVNPFQ